MQHSTSSAARTALALLLLVAAWSIVAVQEAAAQERAVVTIFVRGPEGPVPNAAVVAGGTTIPADERGIARFALLPGTHTFRIERAGFLPLDVTLALAAVRDTSFVVRLMEDVVRGEPIFVLSTRGERRIEDEPLRVEVITREEIEEKLLMTPGSIAMLLDEAAGVRVQEATPALGGASVRIQGLRGEYARILVDGLPLHGAAGALGPLQIPPADLRQVEVIKGPASALYGGAALGGVINLISRLPEDGREVLTNRTSRGGTDVVMWSSGALNDAWGYTLLGGLHAQDQTDVDGDGWADLPRYRRVAVRPRLFWSDGLDRAMITGGFTTESRSGGGFVPGGVRVEQASETRRADAGVTTQLPLSDRIHVDARGSLTWAVHERTFGTLVERDRRTTGYGELSGRGRAANHAWIIGVALEYEGLNVDQAAPLLSFGHFTPALFVQDEVIVTPWLTLSLSARVDAHPEYGAFFSPRGALLAGPFDGWTIRLSSGGGYRVPTPLVEEAHEVGFGRITMADGLRAERGTSTSADFGTVAGPLEFNATLYMASISDPIFFIEPSAPGPGQLVNFDGQTRTYGTELLARLRTGPLAVTAYHTLIHATDPDPATTRRRTSPLTPRQTAGLVAMLEDDDWGRVGIEAYHTGRQQLDNDPYAEESEPYFVVGALVERRIGPLSMFVNAENLTNIRQTRLHPLVRPQPTASGRWTTDVYMPVEGRVVNGGFRVFF